MCTQCEILHRELSTAYAEVARLRRVFVAAEAAVESAFAARSCKPSNATMVALTKAVSEVWDAKQEASDGTESNWIQKEAQRWR